TYDVAEIDGQITRRTGIRIKGNLFGKFVIFIGGAALREENGGGGIGTRIVETHAPDLEFVGSTFLKFLQGKHFGRVDHFIFPFARPLLAIAKYVVHGTIHPGPHDLDIIRPGHDGIYLWWVLA